MGKMKELFVESYFGNEEPRKIFTSNDQYRAEAKAYNDKMLRAALEAQESSKYKKPVAIDWDNVEIDESLIEE